MSKVFIVILNYNGQEDTLECIDSIMRASTSNIRLHTIVVDNNPSHPIKIDEAKYGKINLEILFNKRNLGFSGGMNVGIKKALEEKADYVVLLNNDTIVDKNFLSPLLDVLKKESKAGITVPKIYYAPGYEYHKDKYQKKDLGKVIWYAGGKTDWKNVYGIHEGVDEVDKGKFNQIKVTGKATGCCMAIKADVLRKVGLLDENYFLYYEDADFDERAKKEGYSIYFVPSSIIWHKNAQSSGGSGSQLQDYYVTRNRMYFGLKYAPVKTKLNLLKESFAVVRKGRSWQKRAVLDYYFGIMGRGGFKND